MPQTATQIEDILESMQDAFLQINKDWDIIYVNKKQEQLSGINRKDSLGKNVWSVFPQAVKLSLYDLFQDSLVNKITHTCEEHHPAFNLWMEVSITPTQSGGIIVIFRDVTDKRKLQIRQSESENNFIQLADSMPQMIWTASPEGDVDYFNKRWYDYTGFKKSDGDSQSWLPILHPDDLQYAKDTWDNAVKDGKSYDIEYRFKDRSNPETYRWFLGRALPIKDKDGKITKWFGSCTDITELKQSQSLLQISESQFRFMTDVLPQQIWTATSDGMLDYVNKRVTDFFGKTVEEVIGDLWIRSIFPDDLEHCRETWEMSLATGNLYQVEMRLRNANGNYIWHLARAIPYFSDGKIVKWFGTSTDIEDQKKSEQLKEDFISIASHELRSPLTPIKGYMQMLQKMLAPETKERSFVNKSLDNLQKLETLIRDLDTSKISNDNVQYIMKPFRFDNMVANCVESYSQDNSSHTIHLKNCVEVTVLADSLKIEQVLVNLISNAIKYSPQATEIVVVVEKNSKEVTVSVTDYGIGIARENIDKLFDRFYRVQDTSMKFKGMGLGLYISREIIKKHNGKLWVNSEIGKGTTINFSLPLS
jgi:PAS domain S-box-containing protein